MDAIYKIIELFKAFLVEIGELSYFAGRFFTEAFKRPFEFREFLRQCFYIGNRSLLLVSITGFIIGLVFTLQSRPTLLEFGAVSWMPRPFRRPCTKVVFPAPRSPFNVRISFCLSLWA